MIKDIDGYKKSTLSKGQLKWKIYSKKRKTNKTYPYYKIKNYTSFDFNAIAI